MGQKRIKVRNLEHLREALGHSPLRISSAYLFGSRARGDFLAHSDWDILVVSPDFANIPFPERGTLLLKTIPLRRVETFCYTEEEFRERSKEIGLVREASKGKRII